MTNIEEKKVIFELQDKYSNKNANRVKDLQKFKHELWKKRWELTVKRDKLKNYIAKQRHSERIEIISHRLSK